MSTISSGGRTSAPHRALRPELRFPWGKSQAPKRQRLKEPAETASAGLSLLGGGMDVTRCADVTGGWGCQGTSWHRLPTPAGLAALSHGNEPSLGSQDHGTAGLEETSLQRGHRDAVPAPAGRVGCTRCHRSRPRGRCLHRHEGHNNDRTGAKGKGDAESSTSLRQQQQHRCHLVSTSPHCTATTRTGWGPCTADTAPQTDRQTRAHCCGGAVTAESDGADGLGKRSELMHGVPACGEERGGRDHWGHCRALPQLLLSLCGLGFELVKCNPNFLPPVFPALPIHGKN